MTVWLTKPRDQALRELQLILARGERFKVAWHPDYLKGILRRHTVDYFARDWSGRTWKYFEGQVPIISDVSDSIEPLLTWLHERCPVRIRHLETTFERKVGGGNSHGSSILRWLSMRVVYVNGVVIGAIGPTTIRTTIDPPTPNCPNHLRAETQRPAWGIDVTDSLVQEDVLPGAGRANWIEDISDAVSPRVVHALCGAQEL